MARADPQSDPGSTTLTTSVDLPNASIWIAFMAALSTDVAVSRDRGEQRRTLQPTPTTPPIPLCQRDGLRSDGGGLRRPRSICRFVRRLVSPVPRSAAAEW